MLRTACVPFVWDTPAGGGTMIAGGTLVVTGVAVTDVLLQEVACSAVPAEQIELSMANKRMANCKANRLDCTKMWDAWTIARTNTTQVDPAAGSSRV